MGILVFAFILFFTGFCGNLCLFIGFCIFRLFRSFFCYLSFLLRNCLLTIFLFSVVFVILILVVIVIQFAGFSCLSLTLDINLKSGKTGC